MIIIPLYTCGRISPYYFFFSLSALYLSRSLWFWSRTLYGLNYSLVSCIRDIGEYLPVYWAVNVLANRHTELVQRWVHRRAIVNRDPSIIVKGTF